MQPNILVIVVDALRADRVGALGGRDLTENIDDLAADSMVFSQAFSTSNATDSAVTSIQTGRYPLSHGIVNHGWKVTDKEKQIVQNTKQLSQALSDHGYRTAKFGRPLGRWHRQGFDEYPETGEWRKSNEIDALTEQEMKLGSMLESMDPRVRSAASWVYQRTVKRLRDYLSSEGSKSEIGRSNVAEKFESFVDSDDPFFSFIHLMDTHAPYQVDTEHTQRCLNRFDYENRPLEEVAMEFPEGSYTRERLLPGGRIYETAEHWQDSEHGIGTAVVDAQYDASARMADERVGRIIDILRERDIMDETLIFVLSDHGESLTEHGIFYDHHGLYDVSVQVPLVVHPPGGCEQSHSDDLVQTIDIAPTIDSYTGLTEFDTVDGVSLRPLIEGGGLTNREVVMAEEANTQRRRMIRTDNEKLIHRVDDERFIYRAGDVELCSYCEIEHAAPEEYYNLNEDSLEQTNQATTHADRVAELRKSADSRAREFLKQAPGGSDSSAVEYEDEEEIHDRLEALGYR